MISESTKNIGADYTKPSDKLFDDKKRERIEQPSNDDIETSDVSFEEILDQVKDISKDGTYGVQFEKFGDSNNFMINVIDNETNEIVRQIPPEEILKMKMRLDDFKGKLFEVEV